MRNKHCTSRVGCRPQTQNTYNRKFQEKICTVLLRRLCPLRWWLKMYSISTWMRALLRSHFKSGVSHTSMQAPWGQGLGTAVTSYLPESLAHMCSTNILLNKWINTLFLFLSPSPCFLCVLQSAAIQVTILLLMPENPPMGVFQDVHFYNFLATSLLYLQY